MSPVEYKDTLVYILKGISDTIQRASLKLVTTFVFLHFYNKVFIEIVTIRFQKPKKSQNLNQPHCKNVSVVIFSKSITLQILLHFQSEISSSEYH